VAQESNVAVTLCSLLPALGTQPRWLGRNWSFEALLKQLEAAHASRAQEDIRNPSPAHTYNLLSF
jgi:hypothetical protein